MSSKIVALTSGGGVSVSGDTSGVLELQTNNGTTAMTIDTSQNVSIGTTSPATYGKFSVISSDNSSTTAIGYFSSNNLAQAIRIGYNGIYQATNNALVFGVNNAESMRIDSSGNLLVGQTAPTSAGKINAKFLGGTYNGYEATNSNSGNTGTFMAFFNSASGLAGYIAQTGVTTVSYNTSSDYRLKENIAPMTGALDKVAQLKPVTYTWKADGSDGQGFIAHELQAIVPDCVTGEKDATRIVDELDAEGKVIGQKEEPVYQGIDTSFLVATLTAAIQELKAEVDSLKAQLGK